MGLATDSGGAGTYRGGLGYEQELRTLVDGYYLTVTERTAFACTGIKGGRWGTPSSSIKNPGTPEEESVYTAVDLHRAGVLPPRAHRRKGAGGVNSSSAFKPQQATLPSRCSPQV